MSELKDRIERSMENWRMRVIRASYGNQSMVGCIIIAVLGKASSNPPRFIFPAARIGLDGRVYCPFQHPDGRTEALFSPGTVIEVRDSLRYVADKAKLTDGERVEFFAEIGKWIERDERALAEDALSDR